MVPNFSESAVAVPLVVMPLSTSLDAVPGRVLHPSAGVVAAEVAVAQRVVVGGGQGIGKRGPRIGTGKSQEGFESRVRARRAVVVTGVNTGTETDECENRVHAAGDRRIARRVEVAGVSVVAEEQIGVGPSGRAAEQVEMEIDRVAGGIEIAIHREVGGLALGRSRRAHRGTRHSWRGPADGKRC